MRTRGGRRRKKAPFPKIPTLFFVAQNPTSPSPTLTSHLVPRVHAQGAAAMGTFSSKGLLAGAYADGSETHKTTEEFEAYWMGQIENDKEMAGESGRAGGLPWGMEGREKVRAAEAKAYGAADADAGVRSAYGGGTPGSGVSQTLTKAFATERHASVGGSEAFVPEVALLRVATLTLETLTATLTAKPTPLEAEDRAAFAAAVKKCLAAVLHCRT